MRKNILIGIALGSAAAVIILFLVIMSRGRGTAQLNIVIPTGIMVTSHT